MFPTGCAAAPASLPPRRGKSIRQPFKVGQDIDAVARASITMDAAARVIRDSSRAMARQFLNPASVKQ